MKQLKIKDEFQGLTVTTNILGIGSVTLDTNNIDPSKFEKLQSIGFNIFEEVDVEEPIVLTDNDALADLNDQPRPDNPTVIQYNGINEDATFTEDGHLIQEPIKRGRKSKK